MKKTFKLFVSAVAAMATLAGCAKNEISNQTPGTKTVQVVAKHGDTKTTLLDSKYVRWSATDAIKAYGYLDNYVSTSTTISDGGATATFTFNLGDDEIVYMIYPATAAGERASGDAIHVTIPTEQTAVANGFADGANVAIGADDNGTAYFYSIGALVSFDIKNDNITSIKLECPGATLTGKGEAALESTDVIVEGDDPVAEGTADYVLIKAAQGQTLTNGAKYFAVVYAGDYTNMKITFTRNDGKTATYTNSNKLELEANSNFTIFNAQIPDSKWQGGAPSEEYFVKVTENPTDWTGEYLIVSEDFGIALNGNVAASKMQSAANMLAVSPVDNKISYTEDLLNATVVVEAYQSGYSLYTKGANYIGHASTNNTGFSGSTEPILNNISWNSGAVVITSVYSEVTYTLAANPNPTKGVNSPMINFYKTVAETYKPIYLYRKGSVGPVVTKYDVTCADVTGGTISADPTKAAEGATVTLTATPAAGYEFESWNVTGATVVDATSATTTFTMPAANVNVSATFRTVAIPNKTIAEFIAAEGVNCYLTGVVSNIVNTTYGNFDLTDDSGKIYIYGCLTSEGVAKQFSTLGVEEGDEIKVLASEYEYYQSTTHEAKNVVFVEIVKKQPYLKATASKTSIPAAGETITVTVSTNIESGWKASSDNAAFKISDETATSFKVVVDENTSTTDGRTAKITVSAAGVDPVVLILTQSKKSVGGGTITLDNLGNDLTTTSNTSVQTINVTATGTTDSYTLNYLQGKKQGSAILLAKSVGAFISNKTPIPGNIKSVTVYINSGASGKTTYHCAFSTTECTAAYTTGSTAVNITGGNSNKYTCSVSNAKYFCISLGNANNGQVLKVEVEYE